MREVVLELFWVRLGQVSKDFLLRMLLFVYLLDFDAS
jgi:hypothetical protein